MNQPVTAPKEIYLKKQDEKILVVHRDLLFPSEIINGFMPTASFTALEELINQHKKFSWRSTMEVDARYKQICPYLIFTHENKYFLMQRKSTSSEQRLKNKYTFGIGGHIREDDITEKSIEQWSDREFMEEIWYDGKYTMQPLGIINDERDDVGMVHTGIVYLLKGDSDAIRIRSELKQGQLLTLEECGTYYDSMESWSQLVFDYLIKEFMDSIHFTRLNASQNTHHERT